MSASGPVRILSLTYAEDAWQNAQQQNVREIVRRLHPERFEVTLLAEGEGGTSIGALPHVRLLRLPTRGRAWFLLKHLLRGGYDLLFHPHAGLPEAILVSLPRLLGRRRMRVVLPVEGDVAQLDEVPAWIRRRVDRLYRKADLLVPITEYVAESLRERTGRTGPVVPVGVDLERFTPRAGAREPGPARVLSVGTVKPWKRPEFARYAAERLQDVRFTWVGGGESLDAERARAPENLRFVGEADHRTLADVYRRADVLLHPSRMEGLPKVLLEGLACGLPAVAFDDYRPRFLVERGAGFVVTSPEEMVDSLRTLVEDASLRGRMARAARAVAETHSWEGVAAAWSALFEAEARRARGEDVS